MWTDKPGTASGTLDGLDDVDVSGVSNGQVIVYDDGVWVPGSAQGFVPVDYQDTPTVDSLRDALVDLGLMAPFAAIRLTEDGATRLTEAGTPRTVEV